MLPNDKVYFKNLDSIRFIAAIMVFLQHALRPMLGYLPMESTLLKKWLLLISNGEFGVSIFFVLSGFLISYLLITEHELQHKISLKNFYLRRILRIWPLYFLVILFTFGIYPFIKSLFGIHETTTANIWYHVSFLSNFDVLHIKQQGLTGDAVSQNITWSVAIEEQFYAFWPLLFYFLPKRFWLFVMLLITSGSIMFRIIHYNNPMVLYFHSFSVLIDLSIGGLTALLIKQSNMVRNFFEQANTKLHIILCILAIGLMYADDITATLAYGKAISRLFTVIVFALIIASQAITKQTSILNLYNFSFANVWGKYTYGIYLLHPIAILFVDIVWNKLGFVKIGAFELSLLLVIKFIVTLVISRISYTLFESIFLSIKQKYNIVKTYK